MKLAFNLIIGLLFCLESAIAQDDLREWIDDTGKHKTRAALVKVQEDEVELRLEYGQIRMVPIVRLSKADVAYLRDLPLQQENPPAPPAAKDQPEKIITNSIGMKLVLIPKGTFMMGSPPGEENSTDDERQHEVTISRDYYLGQFEVTQAQYEKAMDMNPSNFEGPGNPVDSISWDDAVEFCKRLSELPEERKAGRVYRLPTEAEWEYACRAGTKTAFSFGESSKSLGNYAWFNTGEQTHRVGKKRPNAWRLHDMHGNVWEWCSDWYGSYPKGAVTDPVGPEDGSHRVLRGGGWVDGAANCRSSSRNRNPHYPRSVDDIALSNDDIGFRVALSLPGAIEAVVAPQLPDQAAVALEATITNSIGMKLVLIPKGTFIMGSPIEDLFAGPNEKQHQVTISNEYYLAVYEVTQRQYKKVMGTNPSYFQKRVIGKGDRSIYPVEGVSWENVVEFCQRLSELPEEKKAGRVYRLPTEAEWEYACRAGSKTAFSFGDDMDELVDHAWFEGNSDCETHPVGKKKPNAWGLYDMHGNVWEWCSDWYGDYPKGAVSDPVGPREGEYRICRGGCWDGASPITGAASCRSASRNGIEPYIDNIGFLDEVGFRVALSSSRTPK